MLPAFPTGRARMSGARPSSSQTSHAAVLWPSSRPWLTELTSAMGGPACTGHLVLGEARTVGRDVAGVPDRQGQDVGRPAELVADLERGGLLALEPVLVDRVDERDGVVVLLRQRADDPQPRIEAAVDRHAL